jgi:hypothetical protein
MNTQQTYEMLNHLDEAISAMLNKTKIMKVELMGEDEEKVGIPVEVVDIEEPADGFMNIIEHKISLLVEKTIICNRIQNQIEEIFCEHDDRVSVAVCGDNKFDN